MILKNQLRRLFWKLGFDVCKLHASTNPLTRRRVLLDAGRVDTVLDVGANRGQFGGELRTAVGYQGRIVSFEPLAGAFTQLREKAARFPGWETHNYALGDAPGQAEINVADNSHSSSILDILPAHLKSAPDSRYIGRETITIKTLDSVFSEVCANSRNIYLKIDTQGFESKVLKGAENSLPRIRTVQMEK